MHYGFTKPKRNLVELYMQKGS